MIASDFSPRAVFEKSRSDAKRAVHHEFHMSPLRSFALHSFILRSTGENHFDTVPNELRSMRRQEAEEWIVC